MLIILLHSSEKGCIRAALGFKVTEAIFKTGALVHYLGNENPGLWMLLFQWNRRCGIQFACFMEIGLGVK